MTTAGAAATRPSPWSLAAPWGGRSYLSDLGVPAHWVEFGTSSSTAPPLVFVHGLGGSHLNWTRVAPELAENRRAYALDLAGFGLTPAAGISASVRANAELLDRFIDTVVGSPAILVGNSMGGMVSILEAAAHRDSVAGIVLVDPSLPVPFRRPDRQVATQFLMYAVPGLGERVLRRNRMQFTARQQVERVLELCFADPSLADPGVIDAGVALIEARQAFANTEAAFLQAARSLMQVLTRPAAYRAALAVIDVPVLLIHGEVDRLVPVSAARATAAQCPSWETLFLPGVGHTPQLEAPKLVIGAVTDWLARHPSLTYP